MAMVLCEPSEANSCEKISEKQKCVSQLARVGKPQLPQRKKMLTFAISGRSTTDLNVICRPVVEALFHAGTNCSDMRAELSDKLCQDFPERFQDQKVELMI
jgi:hypothetical protein